MCHLPLRQPSAATTAKGARGELVGEGGHSLEDARSLFRALMAETTDEWHDGGGFWHRCENSHPQCQEWADQGECMANPLFMRGSCAGSCATCSEVATAPSFAPQPWRMFSTSGVPLESLAADGGIVLAFEGGQWVWPGIAVGFERAVSVSEDGSSPRQVVTLTTLSLRPLVLVADAFLDPEECDHAINRSKDNMQPSQKVISEIL